MSRARLVCSEILSRMSPIHQSDDKGYSNINTAQDKVFNLCFNECSNSENTDVSSVLSEMNSSLDDWLRQKTTCTSMDCIDNNYLSDINFLSIKEPDDVGLELILVNNDNENGNEKKETNLNYCTINGKNSDIDFTDPLLNLVSMNEVLLRKTETKCDNFLDGERKNRTDWDTLSIASRKNDCDVENSSDFAEFSLLPLSFESDTTENDHMKLESLTEKHDSDKNKCLNHKSDSNQVTNVFVNDSMYVNKNNTQQPITIALEVTSTVSVTSSIVTSTSATLSVSSSTSSLFYTQNKKNISMNVKRPNILRTAAMKSKSLPTDHNELKVNHPKTTQNLVVELSNTDTLNESVLDFTNPDAELLTLLPASDTRIKTLKQTEEKRSMQKLNNIEIGSVIVVSNFDGKTRIVINNLHGIEHYEGNTAELTEPIGRNRRPASPAEGKHTVTAVNTAANTCDREQEDQVLHDMLTVLGVTYNMLYNIVTDKGLCIWMCPQYECRRIFNRLTSLKSHILSHYGLKPFKCDFPNCPWSFYTPFKLKRHRETHLKRKDFTCTVADCNRSFTTVYNLNTHLKLHDRPARLKCLVRSCNALFQTRRAMEAHLKTHELALAPYKCSAAGCSKLYFSLGALTAHARAHQHKEDELRCQWENCGRRFDKPCRLRAHMRTHTGDKPYVCRYKDCHWAFTSSSKLKRHQYKHNNERRFRCTIGDCTKAFMRSEHLREHTFTHIAQRTFQCSICGEKCSAKATLYVHKKKYHSNLNKQSTKSSNFNSNQSLTANSTVFIALVSSDNETSNKIEQNMFNPDHGIKDCQLNNETVASTINKNINRGYRKLKTKINKSCARTYLPYDERIKNTNTVSVNNSIVIKNDEALSLSSLNSTIDTDTDDMTNQQTIYFSNFAFQESSDTVATNDDLYNPEDGAEYILLFDSNTNTNFPESTINLKDLD